MKALAIELLRPRIGQFALIAILVGLGSLAGLALPLAAGRIVGELVGASQSVTPALLLATLGFLAVQNGLTYLSNLRSETLGARILADLRKAVFQHVQRLPLQFHEGRPRGTTFSIISKDVDFVGYFLSGFAVSIVPQLVTLVGAAAVMLTLDATLAAPILLVIPIAIIGYRLLARKFRPLALSLRDAEGQVIDRIDESMGVIRTIKSFGREPVEDERFSASVETVHDLRCTLERKQAALQPAIQFLSGVAVLLLFWAIGVRSTQSALTVSEWTALLLYSGMIIRPLSALAGTWGMVQIARGSLSRLNDVLNLAPEELPETWTPPPKLPGDIVFRDVDFRYPNGPLVLEGATFEIPNGARVGILGQNGAGKSTILKLLEGLHFPSQGEVRVGGQSTSDLDLAALRRNVIAVSQQVQLVRGSIRDNIVFGRPDAAEDEIVRASERALADGFIRKLEGGYDAQIGDNGVWLSGGQRQRLALARALLCDPPILVLDEATAMFDVEGEDRFFANCAEIFAGRTVLIVGHTPKVLGAVDFCLTVEAGRVTRKDGPSERLPHAG